MRIAQLSPRTGKINIMDIAITQEQFKRIDERYNTGELIQNIVPHISPEEREFLISGFTPEDWKAIYNDGEDIMEDLLEKEYYHRMEMEEYLRSGMDVDAEAANDRSNWEIN